MNQCMKYYFHLEPLSYHDSQKEGKFYVHSYVSPNNGRRRGQSVTFHQGPLSTPMSKYIG